MGRFVGEIKGKFNKKILEGILGEPTWEWETCYEEETGKFCNLKPGILLSAGWGDSLACCRVWIHTNGLCVGAGMDIASDRKYAREIYRKLLKEINHVG